MKKSIAVVFGTFAPLHQGHIDLIQRAKRQCDVVWVVVSGYKGDRGEQVGLTLQKRFRYIREAFRDDELTSVCKLDETNIPRYPMGWQEWLDQMLQAISYDQTGEELIFFVGESEYQQELSKRGFETVLQERKFGISASMIRENPSKYWKYIAQPFRRQFTKKVLIMGSASNGKTTLAKDLARFYDAPVSLEYAREYQIKNNVRDDELTPKDYYYLLLGQYDQTGEELIFFVGESEYQQELSERGFETVLQERKFGISATMIRENPSKYWKYIAQPFRRQFTKKVLIMGSASNGKTTLAKDLARFYDAPVSLEYAREYQIKNNVRDDELISKDYYYLLLGQYDQTSKLIDSNANRGLVIADTNSLVTKGYYDYYMESEEQEDLSVETFDNLFVSIVAKEKWDLILFVQPIGSYVNDGFRDMTMAEDHIRHSFSQHLDMMREQYLGNIPHVYLADDYLENYEAAKVAIDAIYQAD